ncbi:MAG TPA: hypothetical protein PKA28_10650 [Methylomusa anaerophila]|uniref:Uncharacterized protein n=1 Tax=Methylomusa anaerophila TaxID=1930071 RepID=A0A348AIX5_9FIRM|nr:hypothetical protein [Methylomusa anaerophila]BBB91023.1 hypothetical protein MAMMFC1_01691 [Methylomusa anaerophila]HML88893.1 hypothetical protein [Methylomusa anaerophila]
MITNQEAQNAVQVTSTLIQSILFTLDGASRKREQVQLIMYLLRETVDACTVPKNLIECASIAFGKKEAERSTIP